ncbi:hypothetical protein J437_LFUL008866 [Ladona fulva]|uniref:Uncharacterized protein n=1 Tax=Ladona fulva TaxID=123851 RepID=A0A8K0KBE4_LADFU|nr:hypothetical protein J437_LFUL008866 [Ladona fulva]
MKNRMARLEDKSFVSEEHPSVTLRNLAKKWGVDVESDEFVKNMDDQDPLRDYRAKFCYPKMKDLPHTDLEQVHPEDDCIYLNGNSLGLKPKSADAKMLEALNAWGTL